MHTVMLSSHCLRTHCEALVGNGLDVYPAANRLQQRPQTLDSHVVSQTADVYQETVVNVVSFPLQLPTALLKSLSPG